MLLICDLAGEHFLRRDGNWQPIPVEEEDLPLLVSFAARKEAETFCLAQIAASCHCRPYSIAANQSR